MRVDARLNVRVHTIPCEYERSHYEKIEHRDFSEALSVHLLMRNHPFVNKHANRTEYACIIIPTRYETTLFFFPLFFKQEKSDVTTRLVTKNTRVSVVRRNKAFTKNTHNFSLTLSFFFSFFSPFYIDCTANVQYVHTTL